MRATLGFAVDYREYLPCARLAPIVHCIWTLEGSAAEIGGEPQSILPDGRPELVLHFGEAFERIDAQGRAERQPAVLFAGQLTRRLLLRPTGRIAAAGVRLHPYGAAALLKVPQHDLAGLTIDIGAISRELARALVGVRESAASVSDAVDTLQESLSACADASRIDAHVRHAANTIRQYRGCVSIEDVAARAGVTRRHLERRFKAHVGVSPKRFARITRFQHAVRVLEQADGRDKGAFTAAQCGYADQAHFVREWHEISGAPPGAHLLRQAELTGFFLD
jgi:AraC-like DNA-binding protein